MKRTIKMETCSSCGGVGTKPGEGTGAIMRLEREERSVTRNQLLAFFEKPEGGVYSERYLIDLEFDTRAWSNELVDLYRKAIELAVKKRLEVKV